MRDTRSNTSSLAYLINILKFIQILIAGEADWIMLN